MNKKELYARNCKLKQFLQQISKICKCLTSTILQNLQNNDLPYYVVPFGLLGGLWGVLKNKSMPFSGLNLPK